MPSRFPTAVLASLALVACAPGQADDSVPMTYSEAAAQMDAIASPASRDWPSYRSPPGNVRAEDFRALVGDTVMISRIYDPADPDYDELKVIFIGLEGRYVWCSHNDEEGRFWYDNTWQAQLQSIRDRLVPVFKPNKQNTSLGGLSPLYDGATGDVVWYTLHMGRWWDWDRGHLQERLPAVVYTLCPDFPSAEELGVEVNPAQTARTYDALIAQDPGRRILKPELITTNAVATYDDE